jgi:UDP:flavonoid glycosyltransferase YjiC (YdhE family)
MMNAEFDFNFNSTVSAGNRYYLGSQIDMRRRDTADPNYQAVVRDIQIQVSKGTPLVYCSMGTLPPSNRSEVISFLTKISSAAKNLQCMLIVSFQMNDEERSSLMTDNNHVYIFESVPQLAVLQMASVFVNHGGLNSIKESIEAEVPMLVCPAYATYDHNGNTARVVYHKLGVRIDIDDGRDKIENAITQLLKDDDFRMRLKAFREHNAKYSMAPFIDFVLS